MLDRKQHSDGTMYDLKADFKTISEAGRYTIKKAMEKASAQGAEVVILVQGTEKMDKQYVESQVKLFTDKSPRRAVDKIKKMIVVGMSGNVHRRTLKK